MKTSFALHNFSKIQKEFPPPLPENIAEQIPGMRGGPAQSGNP